MVEKMTLKKLYCKSTLNGVLFCVYNIIKLKMYTICTLKVQQKLCWCTMLNICKHQRFRDISTVSTVYINKIRKTSNF